MGTVCVLSLPGLQWQPFNTSKIWIPYPRTPVFFFFRSASLPPPSFTSPSLFRLLSFLCSYAFTSSLALTESFSPHQDLRPFFKPLSDDNSTHSQLPQLFCSNFSVAPPFLFRPPPCVSSLLQHFSLNRLFFAGFFMICVVFLT